MKQRPLLSLTLAAIAALAPMAPTHAADDFSELDALLAKLDTKETTTELAMTTRTVADGKALEDSAKAGGGGILKPVEVKTVADITPEVVPEVTLPKEQKGGLVTAQAADPEERMNEILEAMNVFQGPGLLPDGSRGYVAVSAPIPMGIKTGSPGYIGAREMAFQMADLQARGQVTSFLQSSIIQERYLGMSKDQVDKSMSPGAAVQQVAASVADNDLDAELAKLGVDPTIYEGEPPEAKRAIFTREFRQKIQDQSSAQVSGCAVLAVTEGPFEGDNSIVVALVYSETLGKLANKALTPSLVARTVPNGSLTQVRSRVPWKNPTQLARQFGAQMLSDGAGNQWIIGYGQAPYTDAMDYALAQEDADLNARAAIMTFVSERVVKERRSEKNQIVQKFNDGSATTDQVQKTLASIKAKSQMPLNGAVRIGQNKTDINGQKVAMVVVAWSPNSAAFADFLKKEMQKVATPGAMDHGTTPAPAPAGGGNEAPAGKPLGPGNSTTSDL